MKKRRKVRGLRKSFRTLERELFLFRAFSEPMSVGYLWSLEQGRLQTSIAWCLNALRTFPELENVGVLAVRGASGLLVGSTVSAITGFPLVLVRKPASQEPSHDGGPVSYSGYAVETAFRDGKTYVIIDDFTDEETTFTSIYDCMHDSVWATARCAGVLLYESTREDNRMRLQPSVPRFNGRANGSKIVQFRDEIERWTFRPENGLGPKSPGGAPFGSSHF